MRKEKEAEDNSMTYFLNAVFTRRRAGREEGAVVGAISYVPMCEEICVRKCSKYGADGWVDSGRESIPICCDEGKVGLSK